MIIDFVHHHVRRRYAKFGIASKRLELTQASVHYYESLPADRPTIVLLHGLGTSSSTWVHVLPHLAKTFHVIAIDLPGFGFSSLPDSDGFFPYNKLQQALRLIIPKLVNSPFVMLGHSLGGWLAADYAILSNRAVKQIVLINPAGISYPGVDEQRRLFDIKDMKSLYVLLNRLWWKYPWYFKVFGPAIFFDLRNRGVPQFVRTVKEDDFLNDRLTGLQAPVSLIWGKDDKVISEETVNVLKRLVPRVYVRYINDCGHVPQLERPKELIALLDETLKDVS